MTLGGDAVSPDLLRQFYDLNLPEAKIFNAYGSSETTNCVSIIEQVPASAENNGHLRFFLFCPLSYPKLYHYPRTLPLNGPLPGVRIRLWDHNMKDVPVGFPGELYVGGRTVNAGYLHLPEVSEKAFLQDISASQYEIAAGWGYLYRTGDSFRLRPDMTLEFLGRVSGDRQIKIRGIRTDLEEIERAIWSICSSATSGISFSAVAVVLHIPPGSDLTDGKLVAYLAHSQGSIPPRGTLEPFFSSIRGDLESRLPLYMVPTAFEFLQAFPQLPSGKMDYKALAGRDLSGAIRFSAKSVSSSDTVLRSLSDTESLLAGIWSGLLGLEAKMQLTAEDGFFAVGGHSLLLPRLQRQIEDVTAVKFPCRRYFDCTNWAL
jgi:acyl-CoA synthetase (AMP-forming)/AMP-acid ligase II